MSVLPLNVARVSNLLRTDLGSSNITRVQKQLLDVQNQLSSGQKLNVPSDNPGDSAIVQQLQKLLEQRQAYGDNLKHAQSQLGEVDGSLGDLTDLLNQAQQIASANVGSDVTPDERASAAAIIKSLESQALSVGNKQFEGVFLFAGDRSTDAPFVQDVGGVKFVGDSNVLANQYDENTKLPFMVDGAEVFGALSTRMKGATNLAPLLRTSTRLTDLKGAGNSGVELGSIQISDGTTTKIVDLSGADTIADVQNAINAAGVGGITAGLAADGNSLILNATAADNITVNEVGGGSTAGDLGILQATAAGAGVAVDGADVGVKVTNLTKLADLRGGAGIDTSGLILTNGQTSANVSLASAVTVEDLLNAVNGSKTGVQASINDTADGIDLVNPTQGVSLTIGENGGTTAADLGIRSLQHQKRHHRRHPLPPGLKLILLPHPRPIQHRRDHQIRLKPPQPPPLRLLQQPQPRRIPQHRPVQPPLHPLGKICRPIARRPLLRQNTVRTRTNLINRRRRHAATL